jgi:hypothetical protein
MAGQLTIDTLRAGSGVLATQNGMTGIAKAWVNFNGSTAAINGSFNVSSVTRNSTGYYTVTFTTAMTNANYVAQVNIAPVYGTRWGYSPAMFSNTSATEIAPTTSAFSFSTIDTSATAFDFKYNLVSVFGA